MGNSLNVPCNNSSGEKRRLPTKEILSNPTVIKLVDSLSGHIRHQTERKQQGSRHRRHRHSCGERPQHAWQESGLSSDWTDDGLNASWRNRREAQSWLHNSWPDSDHSMPRTYDHKQESYDPFTHPRHHFPSQGYRSSRHDSRYQEHPAHGPFNDNDIPDAGRRHRDRSGSYQQRFSDTYGNNISDDGVPYDSPAASRQHHHPWRRTEFSPDRHQFRPRDFPRRRRASSRPWPSRSTHRTPSPSVASEENDDGSRDGTVQGFRDRGRRRGRST